MADIIALVVCVLVAILVLKIAKTTFKLLVIVGLIAFLIVRFIPQYIL